MENIDPFASLAELCRISSSQEDCLRRSRFAGEPEPGPDDSNSSDDQDDSEDIPLETTPIEILSAPESSEEKENDDCSQQDQFHTLPEGSFPASSQGQQLLHHDRVAGDQSVAIDSDCTDISKAVDLGRDTDLGFSEEVILTQKGDSASGGHFSDGVGGAQEAQEKEVIHSESNVINMLNFQSSLKVGSTVSPMKRSQLVTKNLGLKTPTGKNVDKVGKSTENLKSRAQNPKISEEDKDLETPRACLATKCVKSASVLANRTHKLVTQIKSPETSQYSVRPNVDFYSEAKKCEKSPVTSMNKLKSPLKESENLGLNADLDTLNVCLGSNREEVKDVFADSVENLKSDIATPQLDDSEALQNHRFNEAVLIDSSKDGERFVGESSAKREPKFPAEAIRHKVEEVSGNSGFGEGIANSRRNKVDKEVKRMCSHGKRDSSSKTKDDLDGCRSTSPSIAESPGIQRRAEGKRELPVSIAGGSERNARRKSEFAISTQKDNPWEHPILYTLRELEKYS